MNAAAASEDRFALDLALVAGHEEAPAREAFGRLVDWVRPAILRGLVRRGADAQDAQDATQAAFLELWQARARLRARTRAEWYSLVRRSVGRAHGRHWKKATSDAFRTLQEGIPEEDLPSLDAVIAAAEDRELLLRSADALWLGQADARDAELGAAAIQFVWLHGFDLEEAASTFGATVEDVRRWLADPAVVARALYGALCWPGDDLAGHVLRPEAPLTSREMDGLMGGEANPDLPNWTLSEARVVCWRLRNGMGDEEIVQASGQRLDRGQIEEILARVRAAIPYARIALKLRQELESEGDAASLKKTGLWKRMAFEYALRELSLPLTIELAKPPAEAAAYPLTRDQMNNWISGGRLVRQLAEFLLRERT